MYGRVLAPGAYHGALASAAVALTSPGSPEAIEDFQLHAPLILGSAIDGADPDQRGRTVQVVVRATDEASSRVVRVFSRTGDESGWTLHAEGRTAPAGGMPDSSARIEIDTVKSRLSPRPVSELYRSLATAGIDLGPAFRSVEAVWAAQGEALGEIVLPSDAGPSAEGLQPVLLDGCFQVMSALVDWGTDNRQPTYLPIGWQRLWLSGPLPDRVVSRAKVRFAEGEPPWREGDEDAGEGINGLALPEVLKADLWLYDAAGVAVGEIRGFTLKRATRGALLAGIEGVEEFLYELEWREGKLPGRLLPADFLAEPAAVAERAGSLRSHLEAEGLDAEEYAGFFAELERLSRAYALAGLERLGWQREPGSAVEVGHLRRRLRVVSDHERLLGRLIWLLAEAGVLAPAPNGGSNWVVALGTDEPLPDEIPADPEALLESLTERYPLGANEAGLLARCGAALPEVLRGQADPLTLLFGSGSPSAADLYRDAPGPRALNRMVGLAVSALTAEVPEQRQLRVLEVGAGTGSTTASVLSALPAGQFDYTFTDVSAAFQAGAEARFGGGDSPVEYHVLDIEKDPGEQGFSAHAYDLVIAANVLHATRDLAETLVNCRNLLAPSGQLMVVEGTRPLGWLDLTFGLLEGWWRFEDRYRPDYALASEAVWRRALADAGFGEVAVVGAGEAGDDVAQGVIVARGPAQIAESAGTWVLAAEDQDFAASLAEALAARDQTVVVAGPESAGWNGAAPRPGVVAESLDPSRREAWRSLLENLPSGAPLRGVVHLGATVGHGPWAGADELETDVRGALGSALALVQGLSDTGSKPASGLWFVTRGAQVVDREPGAELAGATVWGLGKTIALEAPQLKPRMIDMDPFEAGCAGSLAGELLQPDRETHVAHRSGGRYVARLLKSGAGMSRLRFPRESGWRVVRGAGGLAGRLQVEEEAAPQPGPGEVRVTVIAATLDRLDPLVEGAPLANSLPVGRWIYGRVAAIGADVTGIGVGDPVAGLASGPLGAIAVAEAGLMVPVIGKHSPAGLVAALATFVPAALALELSDTKAARALLVNVGTDGIGEAAIRLGLAAGLEVIATAGESDRADLESLGTTRVFDRSRPEFGQRILETVSGEGVGTVLDFSGSGQPVLDSLSCLEDGGQLVTTCRPDASRETEVTSARPDIGYHELCVDRLTSEEPTRVGNALREVMSRLETAELEPPSVDAWPLVELETAVERLRSGRRFGPIALLSPPLAAGGLREDATYLVTGGLGGIGRLIAGWLADLGARAIVLNGRREPDAAAQAAIDGLRSRGVEVRVELADIADQRAVAAMLERIHEELPPLAGVIHSAGVLADASLANQSWERFERVLWPKVLGAWHLHRATLERDLDLFVLFSSIVGVLGNAGQANHAAANAFLDQLARHRRSLGLPGHSVAWGAWSGLGEAEEQRARILKRLEAGGVGWMTPKQGLQALDRVVGQDVATSFVAPVDWQAFASLVPSPPPLIDDLLSSVKNQPAEESSSQGALVVELRRTPASEREAVLRRFLQGEFQSVLQSPAPPEPTVGFFDLGLDSLMAVEVRNRLNRALYGEYELSNTVVFDHPNIESLARHLAGELGGVGELDALPEPEQRPSVGLGESPIAIVGMACRFPGCGDLAGFWRLLDAGGNAVTAGRPNSDAARAIEPPGDDADISDASKWGAFVEDIDRFDARFFRIPAIEARLMDPQQRLLLETSWEALEDAGMDPAQLRGSRTGVFVGITTNDYRDLILFSGEDVAGVTVAAGNSGGSAVGRVAFTLGLEGPVFPVDTACSSSLVAVHQAVAGLQRGEADLALAGGVNAVLLPAMTKEFAAVGMLASDGKCKVFDSSADGHVRGEGCGIVALKRLSDAEADGDPIWGVIRGSAVNHNGMGASLAVPNGPAQERVIEEALARGGIEPSEVDYLEAHGSGTQLGDPIEVNAAASVYGRQRQAERPLLIGSVKTNVGHLEAAAGIAGLIKTVLSMSHRRIPRHLHFREPSPNIDWDHAAVRVTAEGAAWPSRNGRPPVAGVSAFGFSGTNAHVVLQGYDAPPEAGSKSRDGLHGRWPAGAARDIELVAPDRAIAATAAGGQLRPRQARLLPLSGKSDAAIRDLAARYSSWLGELDRAASDGQDPAGIGADDIASLLADSAWTAGIGRSHFDHRIGVVFGDVAELRRELDELAAAGGGPRPAKADKVAFLYTGQHGGRADVGRSLYESEPIVRAVLDKCDQVVRQIRGTSLLDVMFERVETDADPSDAAWAEPASYALGCALEELWAGIGVRPAAVLGHGIGELSAARAAGIWTLEDGLRFAAARGELMSAVPSDGSGAGRILAVFMSPDKLGPALREAGSALDAPARLLAGGTGAHSLVAGTAEAVAALEESLQQKGIRFQRLGTSHGFNSELAEPILDDLEEFLGRLTLQAPSVAFVSGVTGRELEPDEVLDAAYWRRQARESIAFKEGVDTLSRMGVDLVVEIGPPPEVGPAIEEAVGDGGERPRSGPPAVAGLRRSASEQRAFMEAVAEVYEAGADLAFHGLFAGEKRRKSSIPSYPFQRKRHWIGQKSRRWGGPSVG